MDSVTVDRIESLMQEMADTGYAAGGNVLIIKNGKEECYSDSGFLDIVSGRKVKRNSIFRCYSMTKPVTGYAVMKLIEDGKLDLADPVWKFIPGFKDQTVGENGEKPLRDMQIKDLLDMTSGLTYGGTDTLTERETQKLFDEMIEKLDTDEAVSTYEFADRIGQIPMKFQPGTAWNYGVSADILGAVVEVISGMSYRDFLKKNLFEPLEMEDTDFYVPEDKQDRLSKVYEMKDGRLQLFTYSNLAVSNGMKKIPAFQAGGAGLASTIDDYAKFAGMLMNDGESCGRRYLKAGTVRYFRSGCLMPPVQDTYNWNGLQGYTYGNLMRVRQNIGRGLMLGEIGEYGWDGWLGTYFANDPVNRITMLLMIQRTDAGTMEYSRKIKNVIYSSMTADSN